MRVMIKSTRSADADQDSTGCAEAAVTNAGPRPGLSARWRLYAPVLLFASALGACAAPAADLPPVPPPDRSTYLLGPGDRVRVIIFSDQQLTGEFQVNDSGDVAVPLLGDVQARGLTSRQLEAKVAAGLRNSGLMKNPSVSIEVIAYRPIFMLGEVNKPGQYPYQPGMTAVTAVAVAGGFTYRAVEDVFSIVRNTGGRVIEGRATRQTLLAPGDVLTVYERYF
jgi:polysaccharide export outer membrane protein